MRAAIGPGGPRAGREAPPPLESPAYGTSIARFFVLPVDLALSIHPHPTLSETAAFAAELSEGTITDLMPPKRR